MLLAACDTDAPARAVKKAKRCRDERDFAGHTIWLAVRDAAEEMLRGRRDDEPVN